MSNIHNYPLEAFQINDEDFYDVDYWNGAAFESRKISGATLKAVIGAAASNIYSIDGSLISDRIVDLNGSDLLFEDLATNRRISISDALILIEAGDTDIDGIRPIFLKSDNISLVRKDNLRISLDTGALSANRNQQFQDNDGVIALLSDIPSGDNIYNADGSLTAARFLSLNAFQLFITDIQGQTKFNGGNLIEISANAGQEAIMKFLAGNGEKRGLLFTDQGDDRWEWVAEGLESGANSGTDFVIYRYDDAGVLINKAIQIIRSSGQLIINEAYSLPTADGNAGEVLQTDGAGNLSFQPSAADHINSASSQWSKTLPSPVDLLDGGIANGFTFFDNVADKVANGTTPYYEFDIDFGITITLSGSSGSANINVNGVDYLATYSVSLFQTALNWVTANESALNTIGIMVFALGSGADGRIRFGSANESLLNAISISNITTDLSGIIANEFTGLANAAGDHITVPYIGTEIDMQRLLHTIRTNFNLSTGSTQTAELGLYRYENDSIIGSGIQIQRNQDVTGTQLVLETYTANQNDAFVTGGFYIALVNNSGVTLSFEGDAGILIQTIFQKPTLF